MSQNCWHVLRNAELRVRDHDARRAAFEARFSELKAQLREGFSERAQQLRALIDALESDEAEARAQLERVAHRLAGVAGTYGYTQLGELAAELERHAPREQVGVVRALAQQLVTLAEDTAADATR